MKPRVGLSFLAALAWLAVGLAQPAAPFGVQVAERAPDFTVVDLDGQPPSLSDFRGTPVVLNVWATWCPPCGEEMPLFQEAHNAVNARSEGATQSRVALFLVNLSEGPGPVRAFLETHNIRLPVGVDATREQRASLPDTVVPTASVFQAYRAFGLPTTVFIDSDAIIQARHTGPLSAALLAGYLARIGVT